MIRTKEIEIINEEFAEEGQEEELGFSGSILKELKAHAVLSKEEELDLFQQLDENPDGESAREKIIISNIRLILHIINKETRVQELDNLGLEVSDLLQDGVIGLMKAIRRYDWRLGNKFSTFATYWIKQAIQRAIVDRGYIIRTPSHVAYKKSVLFKRRDEFIEREGRDPSDKELESLAIKNEISKSELELIKTSMLVDRLMSLDMPFNENDDNSLSLNDVIPIQDISPEEYSEDKKRKEDISRILEFILNERERRVIVLRYGLTDQKTRTLAEIGQEFGITRERVRQIQVKAMRKLKKSKEIRSLHTEL